MFLTFSSRYVELLLLFAMSFEVGLSLVPGNAHRVEDIWAQRCIRKLSGTLCTLDALSINNGCTQNTTNVHTLKKALSP